MTSATASGMAGLALRSPVALPMTHLAYDRFADLFSAWEQAPGTLVVVDCRLRRCYHHVFGEAGLAKLSAMIKVTVLLAGLGAGAAEAAEFGAIAYSTRTGSHGYSHNFPTRNQAERAALRNCRAYARDCSVVVYFYNACAALAVGNSYGYGYGCGRPRSGAVDSAEAMP